MEWVDWEVSWNFRTFKESSVDVQVLLMNFIKNKATYFDMKSKKHWLDTLCNPVLHEGVLSILAFSFSSL